MSVLYISEQGSGLVKRGDQLVVEKKGHEVRSVHAFKVGQLVLMGNVSLSPAIIGFLLKEGIDTVFMSYHGKYRGRLISTVGKNIELRRLQFRKLDDGEFRLKAAVKYVQGKLHNCRVLLRRHNRDVAKREITESVHRLRVLEKKAGKVESVDSLMGTEGAGAASYFGCFKHLLRPDNVTFEGRNRRPPKDPVNVLLSLGYTLLLNAVQTQIHVVGLDPYLGCLHSTEYGRPSLVLDLMEEFRPIIVDSLVLSLVNKRVIGPRDFYRPEEREPAAFDFAEDEPLKEGYPILLRHEGMKKFIVAFEEKLAQQVFHESSGQRINYRRIILEQVRLFTRHLAGEEDYVPFVFR